MCLTPPLGHESDRQRAIIARVEGSFTNVFVERDGVLVTPPLSRGLLPGVLRGALIDAGKAAEADVRVEELQSGFLLGNSVRGLTAVPASALLRAAS